MDFPVALTDLARRAPYPTYIRDEHDQNADGDTAVEPGRQLVNRPGGLRMIGDAEAKHGGVAEPKGETSDKADLRYFDRIEPISRIDAVTHGATGENRSSDVVTNRIAREAGERRNTIRNLVAANGPQSEPVIEGECEVPASDKKSCSGDMMRLGRFQRRDHLIGVDIAEHMKKDDTRNGNDGDAQNHADPITANLFLKKSRHRAQPLDNHSSGV